MRLSDASCYIFLTITIFLSCARADEESEVDESQPDLRISKRDATVLIDHYPFERVFQKPKMVYRRYSKHHYVQPKLKYGPIKPKHAPKPRRSPARRLKTKPKRAHPNHKKRSSKPRYGSLQKPHPKPIYRPPKKAPAYTYFSPVSSGFGEPPAYDYRPPRQSYAVHPVDSYGEPIKPVYEDVYPETPSLPTTTDHLDNQNYNLGQEYQNWVDFGAGQTADSTYEYSRKVPVITKPDAPIYVTPAPEDDYGDLNGETEASVPKQNYYSEKKKKRHYSNSKIVKKPWRLPKKPEADNEIIVGGQYAEPPARFFPRSQSSAPMYDDDEEQSPHQPFDVGPSETHSQYVNYKNSNMAFSPQNLNDVFSIVDK